MNSNFQRDLMWPSKMLTKKQKVFIRVEFLSYMKNNQK